MFMIPVVNILELLQTIKVSHFLIEYQYKKEHSELNSNANKQIKLKVVRNFIKLTPSKFWLFQPFGRQMYLCTGKILAKIKIN